MKVCLIAALDPYNELKLIDADIFPLAGGSLVLSYEVFMRQCMRQCEINAGYAADDDDDDDFTTGIFL